MREGGVFEFMCDDRVGGSSSGREGMYTVINTKRAKSSSRKVSIL